MSGIPSDSANQVYIRSCIKEGYTVILLPSCTHNINSLYGEKRVLGELRTVQLPWFGSSETPHSITELVGTAMEQIVVLLSALRGPHSHCTVAEWLLLDMIS